MREEQLVSGTQVVQAFLSIRRANESMFRAFAMTGKADVTFAAVARQGVKLVLAEGGLRGAIHHTAQTLAQNIAQLIFGIDKMVTRIEVPVMFQRER